MPVVYHSLWRDQDVLPRGGVVWSQQLINLIVRPESRVQGDVIEALSVQRVTKIVIDNPGFRVAGRQSSADDLVIEID